MGHYYFRGRSAISVTIFKNVETKIKEYQMLFANIPSTAATPEKKILSAQVVYLKKATQERTRMLCVYISHF